ncbi:MAG: hypothetical protein EXS08_12985 [Planctomycetes bacterium]|nr:hypothetical protein [Planctomycetota bacterium]
MKRRLSLLLPAFLCASVSFAQANKDDAIDLSLASITDITALGRTGTFPSGMNGVAFETTCCNEGTKQINWHAAMQSDHPYIVFIVARELNGRFEQISDWSYVKHGFFALSNSLCSTCSPTDGSMLGLGCSDTYGTGNNGDNYWLGPPEEIDPWLGQWNPVCSHFDRGEPDVGPPNNCNGVRSLTGTMAGNLGPVGHRIHIKDADLNVAGATLWFQGMYVIETEGDRVRNDNMASRKFTAAWNGTRWNLNETGAQTFGSVLSRWSGASVNSAANGVDDGRLYVAVKVTGPVDGFYHYEYAVQNRDNSRGVNAFRIPMCSGARVQNLAFGDNDDDAGNDWSASVAGGEIAWSTGTNALKWNSIYNFSFNSDAAPVSTQLALDEAAPGPGLPTVLVTSSAPAGLFNMFLGAGCANDVPPTLFASGSPARAALGNASFAIESTGNDGLQPNVLKYSLTLGSHTLGACTLYLGPTPGGSFVASSVRSDVNGRAVHAAPVPNDLALEGVIVSMQAVGRDPGNGTLFGNFEMSDGLEVRIGSALSDCP